MTGPKYQIFVSSTYEDLRDERDQVIKAVLEMGHIPVGMEMFSAADEQQWALIQRHIDQSDYYVVIIAHRYGSITPEGISYTRKEYEYAVEAGVPILGFVIDPAASWPAANVDSATELKEALDEFKALARQRPVSEWSEANDLYGRVSIALSKAFTVSPRDGWVRAGEAVGPEVAAEITRLSAENAKLRLEIETLKQQSKEAASDQLSDSFEKLHATQRSFSYRRSPRSPWEPAHEASLWLVFRLFASQLMIEASIQSLASTLALNLKTDDEGGYDIVPINQVRDVILDFQVLGLVEPSQRKHAVSDDGEYWTLTDDGRELESIRRKLELDAAAGSAEPQAPASDGTGAKKTAAKKATAKKTAAKKATAKKTAAKKAAAKKTAAKKTAAKKTAAKKTAAKKTAAKKAAAKKTAAKKATAKQ